MTTKFCVEILPAITNPSSRVVLKFLLGMYVIKRDLCNFFRNHSVPPFIFTEPASIADVSDDGFDNCIVGKREIVDFCSKPYLCFKSI